MRLPEVIDLHMHTTVSDGTDTPEEIVEHIKKAGIELFSVTDHDAIEASAIIKKLLKESAEGCTSFPAAEVRFITGIEFSCRDNKGKYHILGYGYDETAKEICSITGKAHDMRIAKVRERLDYIYKEFGFSFSPEDIAAIFKNHNPGKPHIANMMIKYGYAGSIHEAMSKYLNKKKFPNAYTLPEDAIDAVIKSGGIPVLAHPSFGDGGQMITGEEMDARLKHLMEFGLKGVEAYYSGFTKELTEEILSFADKYDLYISAGSDYHGSNKTVHLGDTNMGRVSDAAPGLKRFINMFLQSAEMH